MTIKKRTATFTGDVAAVVGLGAKYGIIRAVDLKSSADTSVAIAATDGTSGTAQTVFSFASADYTTKTRRYPAPVESLVVDTGADASADTEGATAGAVIAVSPITITPTGLGSGTFTVDVYVEVDRLS